MKIACLGWGSLIWSPGNLPVQKPWFNDGPLLPIEFARESGTREKQNRRITLVITPHARLVPTLWAWMSLADLHAGTIALAKREGIKEEHIASDIGVWTAEEKDRPDLCDTAITIGKWALVHAIEAVVWTNLPPGLSNERGTTPPIDAVISFLKERLTDHEAKGAEEYVRCAPIQIDTDYRRQIREVFGWTPTVCD